MRKIRKLVNHKFLTFCNMSTYNDLHIISHTKYAEAYETQTLNTWMAWELPIIYKQSISISASWNAAKWDFFFFF